MAASVLPLLLSLALTVARKLGSCLFLKPRVGDFVFCFKTSCGAVLHGTQRIEAPLVVVAEFNDGPPLLLRSVESVKQLVLRLLSASPVEAMSQFRGRMRKLRRGRVAVTVLLLAVLVSPPVEGRNATGRGVVRLAVIAPADPEHEQSLYRVLPAVQLAVRKVSDPITGTLPGWDIRVDHRDSRCSSTFGPLAAFEFYINRSAGITATGPIALRQSNLWVEPSHFELPYFFLKKFINSKSRDISCCLV
jgi:hypothetical protein